MQRRDYSLTRAQKKIDDLIRDAEAEGLPVTRLGEIPLNPVHHRAVSRFIKETERAHKYTDGSGLVFKGRHAYRLSNAA